MPPSAGSLKGFISLYFLPRGGGGYQRRLPRNGFIWSDSRRPVLSNILGDAQCAGSSGSSRWSPVPFSPRPVGLRRSGAARPPCVLRACRQLAMVLDPA
jgi:hypothetical protein